MKKTLLKIHLLNWNEESIDISKLWPNKRVPHENKEKTKYNNRSLFDHFELRKKLAMKEEKTTIK